MIWGFYNALNEHRVAMRHGDYKILARLTTQGGSVPMIMNVYKGNEATVKEAKMMDFELYNLREDRAETTSLTLQNPEVFKKMKILLQKEYTALLYSSYIWRELQ